MPYGQRGLSAASGPTAEGDKSFGHYVWNDSTVPLAVGMPVYKELTDAAEFNTSPSTTAISGGVATSNKNTGGNVVSGTSAVGHSGAHFQCVGIYAPPGGVLPAGGVTVGSAIRVQLWGVGQVLVTENSISQGFVTCSVGSPLVGTTSCGGAAALSGTPNAQTVIGIALATSTANAVGTLLSCVNPAGGTLSSVLVNAFIALD